MENGALKKQIAEFENGKRAAAKVCSLVRSTFGYCSVPVCFVLCCDRILRAFLSSFRCPKN